MKTINVTFEDDQFEKLKKRKKEDESWRDFILRISGVSEGASR